MRKTGVTAFLALLLVITGTRAGPLFNSTIATDVGSADDNAIGGLSNKTGPGAAIRPSHLSRGSDSNLGVTQNATANATKTPGFDSIVGVIQNSTANATKNLLGGNTAVNWSCGVNVSHAVNQSGGDADSFPTPKCAAVLPSNVSTVLPTNVSTANCKNSTHCLNASVASGNNGTRVTERNTTLRNDTLGEHMLNDEGVPKINETVDGDSSVCPPLVSREGWGGRPPLAVEKVRTPVPFVVIHHTYIPGACNTSDDCEAKMRSMQDFHMGKGWLNIGYNFIVGGDNRVYVGRGWDTVGAHSPTYNFKSVGISFIGDYRTELPTHDMLELAWSLIRCGVARGSISDTYKLVGHRQVRDTECPGDRLYQEIQTWPHWVAHRDIIPRTNATRTS
ncbi:peptidoglycan-recognition protein LC-like [Schistocerca cancellata]|uniref:peptidoglycan-recognition protein LC-like n=1 Tax=Schistocerca cancellata TaxID=274614 RepID=UPI002119913C|nr:peptidoglycan-recognition protein LC-like [Schistocerca cancellata]